MLNKQNLDKGLKLPRRFDNFYFDGYPRSGNTYVINLIMRRYTSLTSSSHLHSIAGIKIALKKNIPTLIIIRHPSSSITSFLYTKINRNRVPSKNSLTTLIDALTLEYCQYYEFVFRKKEVSPIQTMDFSCILDSEVTFLQWFESWISLLKSNEDPLYEYVSSFKTYMKSGESKKETAYSSLPNNERELFKAEKARLVEKGKYYNRALTVYQNINASRSI